MVPTTVNDSRINSIGLNLGRDEIIDQLDGTEMNSNGNERIQSNVFSIQSKKV